MKERVTGVEREWVMGPTDMKKATWWKSNPGNWQSAIFNNNMKSVWDEGMKGWKDWKGDATASQHHSVAVSQCLLMIYSCRVDGEGGHTHCHPLSYQQLWPAMF